MAQSGPDAESVDVEELDPSADENDDAEDEWQFGLDEVGPDGALEAEPDPIEPETPELENVLFVLVGIVGMLLLLSTVI